MADFDGSKLSRPPAHPVPWQVECTRSGTRTVVTATTWFEARSLGMAALGVPDLGGVVVERQDKAGG